MKLPKEAVTEFIDIYENKFGITLAYEKAEQKAINFLKLVVLITGSKNENTKSRSN